MSENSIREESTESEQLSLFYDFDEQTISHEAPKNETNSISTVKTETVTQADSKTDNKTDMHEANEWNSTIDTEKWIVNLKPTDTDALTLGNLQPATLTIEQAAKLWAKLAAWAQSDQIAYYVEDSPTSSDAAYDARMRALSSLEAAFPTLDTPQSPTHRVGGTFSNDFTSVKHPSRMMSLDDVFSIEELHDWYNSVIRDLQWDESQPLPMTCEVKIDGLALNLIYRNGTLEQGLTRA